jgi:hypothetical protein
MIVFTSIKKYSEILKEKATANGERQRRQRTITPIIQSEILSCLFDGFLRRYCVKARRQMYSGSLLSLAMCEIM